MVELLNNSHNRTDFDCGNEQLTKYFKIQAGQDMKRKLSVCFVWTDSLTNKTIGYYTLSNSSIPLIFFPEQINQKLPLSYQYIPCTLIGRLAIDKSYQEKKMGEQLLINALITCYKTSLKVASFAVVVDPIDENAIKFYKKYDFTPLPHSGKMFITMKTLTQLFN